MEGAKLAKIYATDSQWHFANLANADLTKAELIGAQLYKAVLNNANLSGVDARNSVCRKTDFRRATLRGSDFRGADLLAAEFDKEEAIRKGVVSDGFMKGYIEAKNGSMITLVIPCGAVVFSINNGKCRTNMARLWEGNGAISIDGTFFEKGETSYCTGFNCQYNEEEGRGIYFFRTREEAEKNSKMIWPAKMVY